MCEVLEQNFNKITLAFLSALVVHFSLAFFLMLPTDDVHEVSKGPLESLKVKLISYVEDEETNPHQEIINIPIPHSIVRPIDKPEVQKPLVEKIVTTNEPETIAFSYSDLEKWIESDTARILEQENKITYDSKTSSQRSRTVGYGTIDDINREQIILQDKIITSYESGLYSVDVKAKLFGRDICYKFDHSQDSFGVVTPYGCPRKDVIQLDAK